MILLFFTICLLLFNVSTCFTFSERGQVAEASKEQTSGGCMEMVIVRASSGCHLHDKRLHLGILLLDIYYIWNSISWHKHLTILSYKLLCNYHSTYAHISRIYMNQINKHVEVFRNLQRISNTTTYLTWIKKAILERTFEDKYLQSSFIVTIT